MGKLIKFKANQTKEGEIMCETLSKIRGMTAEKLLETYGKDLSIPVDIKQLLENIGIASIPMDFSEIEKEIGANHGDVLGLVLSKDEKAAILYRKDDTLNRKRFTLAHELAHCCLHSEDNNKLHIEFRLDDDKKDQHEKDADIFAGELLIPLKQLAKEHLKMMVPNSKDLARIFGVSIAVMEARLDYLRVSYYNRNGQAVVYENE